MMTRETAHMNGFATSVFTMLAQFVRPIGKLVVARRNRKAVLNLNEWNDHMLHDVGLTRADLHAALGHSALHDPTAELGAMADARVKQLRGRSIRRA
ncbi:MAG: DUF1127 domain-containing protein [Phyllobacterium sp.]